MNQSRPRPNSYREAAKNAKLVLLRALGSFAAKNFAGAIVSPQQYALAPACIKPASGAALTEKELA